METQVAQTVGQEDTQAESAAQRTPNSIPALRERRADGRLGWLWPLTMNFIRFPLLIAGFFIALAIYQAAGNPDAQTAALLTSNFYQRKARVPLPSGMGMRG